MKGFHTMLISKFPSHQCWASEEHFDSAFTRNATARHYRETFQCKIAGNTQDPHDSVNQILWQTQRLIIHTPFHRLSAVFSNLHLPFTFLKEELDEW